MWKLNMSFQEQANMWKSGACYRQGGLVHCHGRAVHYAPASLAARRENAPPTHLATPTAYLFPVIGTCWVGLLKEEIGFLLCIKIRRQKLQELLAILL